jgi:hypothetical protein
VPQPLREELEAVLRGWNAYEIGRGAAPVIDFDLRPDLVDAIPIESRLEAYQRCTDILRRASAVGAQHVADRAQADATYLAALLGAHLPLADYVRRTQGCDAAGWSEDYVSARQQLAEAALAELGIDWGRNTKEQLQEFQGPISAEQAAVEIGKAAEEFEPAVRAATGATTPYNLTIETADVDAYWHYWLDGAGSEVRLRLNLRHAHFTQTRSRQFALHEVLGHGLQAANIGCHCREHDVPWVRLFSVHAQQQTLLEGLAQALPLFVASTDKALVAAVRLDHYSQLVRAELHLAINRGDAVESCIAYARAQVPFWSDEEIGDALADRSVNPLLRSYLWSYPAGIDWFVNLAEATAPTDRVLHAAYRQPLRPVDLALLWPDGPPVGGGHEWAALQPAFTLGEPARTSEGR